MWILYSFSFIDNNLIKNNIWKYDEPCYIDKFYKALASNNVEKIEMVFRNNKAIFKYIETEWKPNLCAIIDNLYRPIYIKQENLDELSCIPICCGSSNQVVYV